jgi:outer membrane lipoprotein-sorting protein
MKACCAIGILLAATMSVFGDEQRAGLPALKAFHGTMVTLVSGDEGPPCEIWASGDNVRMEHNFGGRKIITIQRGDTMYTYGTDSRQGNKTRFETGLASMGLIKQIAEIKAKGKMQGSREIEGISYGKFLYRAPHEEATVYLAMSTSLPGEWESAVETGEKKATRLTMRYRNMEANVKISDDMFALPRGVVFSDVAPGELIAIGREFSKRSPTVRELKTLHGTMLIKLSDDKDQRLEIWAKDNNVRTEHAANEQRIINIQLGDILYTYPKGSKTGKKRRMAPGLRSRGLIKQIELIKSKGTKEGSQMVDGTMYDKYRYDADAPAEKASIWLAPETSIPGIWISHLNRPEESRVGILVMQYRDMTANREISDELFAVPRGVTFSDLPRATGTK